MRDTKGTEAAGQDNFFSSLQVRNNQLLCLKLSSSNVMFRLPLPVTSKHLAPVLNFIREQSADSLDLTEDNVIDIATLADFLDVQDITEECCE